jgi:hypothetical protein
MDADGRSRGNIRDILISSNLLIKCTNKNDNSKEDAIKTGTEVMVNIKVFFNASRKNSFLKSCM